MALTHTPGSDIRALYRSGWKPDGKHNDGRVSPHRTQRSALQRHNNSHWVYTRLERGGKQIIALIRLKLDNRSAQKRVNGVRLIRLRGGSIGTQISPSYLRRICTISQEHFTYRTNQTVQFSVFLLLEMLT